MSPRDDRAVRASRRAVRGRRLSRRQAVTLDRLLSVVANKDASLLGVGGGRAAAGGRRAMSADQSRPAPARQSARPRRRSQWNHLAPAGGPRGPKGGRYPTLM